MEQALKFYRSPEYAPLLRIRQKASRGKLVIVEVYKRKGVSRRPFGPPPPVDLVTLDHRAREARAGVARGLGLVVVRVGVDDEAAADDARRPRRHRDGVELDVDLGAAVLAALSAGRSPAWRSGPPDGRAACRRD